MVNRVLLGLVLAGFFASAQAAEPPKQPKIVASVSSPANVLKVDIGLDEDRASYSVSRLGVALIRPSRLGFLLRNTEKLDRNLELTSQSTGSFDQTWEQPWGERRFIRNHYNELKVRFTEKLKLKRSFDLVFRVYDDGVGFRYEFPDQPQLHDVIIDDELTEFTVVPEATAWWIPAGEWNRYEYLYNRTPLTEVGQAHTPMTIRTRDGLHIAFHEAALVDYSSMWLRRVEQQRFRAQLAPAAEGWKVHRTAPFVTPWRTMIIADTAGQVYESNLELNLNEPNKLGDVSWFQPGKFAGVWWELHLENTTWATGPRHGATTANTRRYIDFAAKYGIRGVLVEGWNLGWDGQWFGNGNDFDFVKATPDFDLEALAAYAKHKGVHLVGHHETGGAVSHYESQLVPALDLYQRLGVDVVKGGYVADAGQIERNDGDGVVKREFHDGQWMSNHHLRVVTEAAKRHIAVDPHEPIKDTGLRRTYPNWVAREGARGQEYMAWGNPPNPPEHEVNLVFTRMLAGPFDFTPGIVSLKGRGGRAIPSTVARQLAQYVTIYSPIQMVADLPENYAAHMDAFQFIRDVPTDWSETLVLNGEVGDYVTIARKDRRSEDWFLGSETDENGRELSVPLSFLDPRRKYAAQIYRDGDDADYQGAPFSFAVESRDVTAADTLTIRLAPGGGQAIRFKAKR